MVRFGRYVQETRLHRLKVRYGELLAGSDGGTVDLRPGDVFRLVQPYVTVRFVEPPVITTQSPLPPASVGVPYNFQFTAMSGRKTPSVV